jgi:Raf kinase inhibitor-like YbhB/YbcL family protein
MIMKKIFLFFALVLTLAACAPSLPEPTGPFELTSPAFTHEGKIPVAHSCDGINTSPPLAWTNAPSDTKSYVLIMDDPDAGEPWVHWVIFNIPSTTTSLEAAISTRAEFEDGTLQGRSSMYTRGYHGPCPPSGAHRYFFKLYALDTVLDLSGDANKQDLLVAMEGHILANTELMATYGK